MHKGIAAQDRIRSRVPISEICGSCMRCHLRTRQPLRPRSQPPHLWCFPRLGHPQAGRPLCSWVLGARRAAGRPGDSPGALVSSSQAPVDTIAIARLLGVPGASPTCLHCSQMSRHSRGETPPHPRSYGTAASVPHQRPPSTSCITHPSGAPADIHKTLLSDLASVGKPHLKPSLEAAGRRGASQWQAAASLPGHGWPAHPREAGLLSVGGTVMPDIRMLKEIKRGEALGTRTRRLPSPCLSDRTA